MGNMWRGTHALSEKGIRGCYSNAKDKVKHH